MINKIKGIKFGFTLTETLIVISIFGVVAAASFLTFSEGRSQAVLDDAQASVVNALERARSRAATGVGTTSHGVYITNDKIYPCEGDPCVTSTEFIGLKPFVSATKTNPSQPIIFNRLTAKSSENATITIEYTTAGIATTVSVTEEGIIEK